MNPTHVDVKEAASRFSVSVSTWWRWVAAGRAPQPIKLSPGCTRWAVSDLDAWAEEKLRASRHEK